MASKQYYDIKPLFDLCPNASYYMLLGMRANGKSYQCKKTVLQDAWINKNMFVYLRRFERHIKQQMVTDYFKDCDEMVKDITEGYRDGVIAYQGYIYFYHYDPDNGKIVRDEAIGRYCALNLRQMYKSQVFTGGDIYYSYIMYEEFIADKGEVYLDQEPRALQQFVSTVSRQEACKVLLIGNTLSRVSPYFSEWSLEGTLNMKPGEKQVYHYHVDNEVIDVAVEMCGAVSYKNKMFFGTASKQIVSGEWDVNDMPHLPRPKTDYIKCYEVLVEYKTFKFIIELLVEPKTGGLICFIYPHTSTRKVLRVLSKVFSDNPLKSAKLDLKRRPEQLIYECFMLGKVCYSDNMTGTDFNNVNEYFKIGQLVSE